jgi:hypothetical protein
VHIEYDSVRRTLDHLAPGQQEAIAQFAALHIEAEMRHSDSSTTE